MNSFCNLLTDHSFSLYLPFLHSEAMIFSKHTDFQLSLWKAILSKIVNLSFFFFFLNWVLGLYLDFLEVSEVAQSCPTLCNPFDSSLPGSSLHGALQARILEWVARYSSRESSQPRYWTQVSSMWVDSLPSEPPWKPKNTGVGDLSLLHGNFQTQELNRGLLHCSLEGKLWPI